MPVASKAPVRRADPARRDRSQARAMPVAGVDDAQVSSKDKIDSRFRGNDGSGDVGRAGARTDARPNVEQRAEKPNMDSRLRGNDERTAKPDGARQRNHRFDGKAHGEPFAEQVSEDKSNESRPTYNKPAYNESSNKPNENRPLRSNLRAESASESKPRDTKQPDFNHTDFNQTVPKQHKPAGIDTRTTPRPDKNEPQYRQAPRRGGKVRDGYDAVATPQYGAAAKAAYKSSPVNVEQPRLSKVMAERGLCSRREADGHWPHS